MFRVKYIIQIEGHYDIEVKGGFTEAKKQVAEIVSGTIANSVKKMKGIGVPFDVHCEKTEAKAMKGGN